MRILIADDHPIFRQGLRQLLLDSFPDALLEEANEGAEVLQRCRAARYDAIILDISMPGRNGLEILGQINHDWPGTPVLIVSMHSEDQYAVQAIKAGASGYLTKSGAAREVVSAVRRVIDGELYISPAVAEQLAFQVKDDAQLPRHASLSAREHQVLCMLAVGKGIKDIAGELALSTSTVSTHRARILRKLDMHSNAEIIRYAIAAGLVDY